MSEFINTIDELGDKVVLDSIIDGTITEFKDNVLTEIASYSFGHWNSLKTLVFPNVIKFGASFTDCKELETVDLASATSLGSNVFNRSSNLTTLIIRTNTLCTLGSYSLNQTKISNGTGYIYVPRALVDSYKSAPNWGALSNQFRALEDYTVDGTTTGELDPTKI